MIATLIKINEGQDKINEELNNRINNFNDIVQGITKLKEPTLKLIKFNSELYKLADAGLKDYATEISKVCQVPANEIIHRIQVASGMPNPDKGLSLE